MSHCRQKALGQREEITSAAASVVIFIFLSYTVVVVGVMRFGFASLSTLYKPNASGIVERLRHAHVLSMLLNGLFQFPLTYDFAVGAWFAARTKVNFHNQIFLKLI